MRALNRGVGIVVALLGFGLAAWAPLFFSSLSGHPLPNPVATNSLAMAIWSGVAFARAFGAVLVGVGAVLWASNATGDRPQLVQRLLCASFIFATLIAWIQQVAIWSGPIGWALVGLFGGLAIVTALGLRQPQRQTASPVH